MEEEEATRLVNSCNGKLLSLFREARAMNTDAILTGMIIHATGDKIPAGFPVGTNLFVKVMPRPAALEVLRLTWAEGTARMTSGSSIGIFEIYLITKDAVRLFRKPVDQFLGTKK